MKWYIKKFNKFLDWALKQFSDDIQKSNEIIATKNQLNKTFKSKG